MKAFRAHDDTVVDLLKADPMNSRSCIWRLRLTRPANREGITHRWPRASLQRALWRRANPTLKTGLTLLNATGLRLGVHA